ncbi:MAG: L-2-amino-thiazoline-4-carboxylic acid hydrolase [Paracraurococcus sp.]
MVWFVAGSLDRAGTGRQAPAPGGACRGLPARLAARQRVGTMADIGILQQRRIEAAFAKGVFEEMAAELGAERAKAILTRAVVKLAKQTAGAMAAAAPEGPGLDHFVAIQELWTRDDALRIEPVARDTTRFEFNVTRCRYAEMYREMGLAELGAVLSCNRDGAFCEGYDPRLKLTRTQTLMGGAAHCDFRYQMAETEGG